MEVTIQFGIKQSGDHFIGPESLTDKQKRAAVIQWLADEYIADLTADAEQMNTEVDDTEEKYDVIGLHEGNLDCIEFDWNNEVLAAVSKKLLEQNPDWNDRHMYETTDGTETIAHDPVE